AGAAGARLEAYWRRQLAGPLPALDLPADRPRPRRPSFRGADLELALDRRTSDRLRALAAAHDVTLYAVLLAAFMTLLHRLSGQEEVIVGSPTAGREDPRSAELVGFFVNPVVLRGDLGGAPSFSRLLRRLRPVVRDAFAHRDWPYPRLVEALAPGAGALFEASFVWLGEGRVEDRGLVGLALGGSDRARLGPLELAPVALRRSATPFDLTVFMGEVDGRLAARLEYRLDRLSPSAAERLGRQLETLLGAIAEDADRRIDELPLARAEDERRLAEWSTGPPARPAVAVEEAIARRAADGPELPALCWETADGALLDLSYGELRRRVVELAAELRRSGVGPETRVGIFMERAPEMVIAILAVLEAGGAYLPLDPSYPTARLAFKVEDAAPLLLLTQSHLRHSLPAEVPAWIVDADGRLSRLGPAVAGEPIVPTEIDPDHAAYVLYTSGSTGRPKGVVVSRRALANHMAWMLADLPLSTEDAVLQRTPISFDASVWELFAPLMAGARLVLARAGGHGDPAYLARAVAAHRVTVMQAVPALWQLLVEEPALASANALRRICAGGETLTAALAERLAERLPQAQLVNLYGPTECTIDAAFAVADLPVAGPSVPIGRPIAGNRVQVVDPALRPVPVGVAGELLIGGAGLARGYLGRPALTAERFVPDPSAARPGDRLYRTGDRVRWRESGELVFLGRLDQQVKLRGFRLELGEIEAILLAQPAVGEAAVVVDRDAGGDGRLVAYVCPRRGAAAEATALRAAVERRLPSPMVPQAFVVLERLPRTPSGKIDRRALPAPPKRPATAAASPAPSTEIEQLLAAIWQQVLEIEEVGIHDDFFALGGHSLLAMRVLSRLREELGVELPVRALLESPTIAGLAEAIARALLAEADDETVAEVLAELDGEAGDA
ncbi:MAG: amino acid adenylation domain-containing protein, partial [Acidobacteria bacterium]